MTQDQTSTRQCPHNNIEQTKLTYSDYKNVTKKKFHCNDCGSGCTVVANHTIISLKTYGDISIAQRLKKDGRWPVRKKSIHEI
jgi:ribosomal protein S27AE